MTLTDDKSTVYTMELNWWKKEEGYLSWAKNDTCNVIPLILYKRNPNCCLCCKVARLSHCSNWLGWNGRYISPRAQWKLMAGKGLICLFRKWEKWAPSHAINFYCFWGCLPFPSMLLVGISHRFKFNKSLDLMSLLRFLQMCVGVWYFFLFLNYKCVLAISENVLRWSKLSYIRCF